MKKNVLQEKNLYRILVIMKKNWIKEQKQRLFEILELDRADDYSSKLDNYFIIFLVFISIVILMLETVESLNFLFPYFYIADIVIYIIFTIEYILRIWIADLHPQYEGKKNKRLRYAFSFTPMIDLIAILPFLLPMFTLIDLRFIRVIRFFRIFRLLKLNRYNNSLTTLSDVVKEKKEDLIISFFLLFMVLFIASCLMYYTENHAQPKVFASIPHAMWWGVATLTTIGYGDIYPITMFGKILSSVIALLSIGFVGLPTGIIASGYIDHIHRKNDPKKLEKIKCPHCGQDFEKDITS